MPLVSAGRHRLLFAVTVSTSSISNTFLSAINKRQNKRCYSRKICRPAVRADIPVPCISYRNFASRFGQQSYPSNMTDRPPCSLHHMARCIKLDAEWIPLVCTPMDGLETGPNGGKSCLSSPHWRHNSAPRRHGRLEVGRRVGGIYQKNSQFKSSSKARWLQLEYRQHHSSLSDS
jgi:hypothetical protein